MTLPRNLTLSSARSGAGAPVPPNPVFDTLQAFFPMTEVGDEPDGGNRYDVVGGNVAEPFNTLGDPVMSATGANGGPLGRAADLQNLADSTNAGFAVESGAWTAPRPMTWVGWFKATARATVDGIGRTLLAQWGPGGNRGFIVVNEAFGGNRLFRSLDSTNGTSFVGNDMDGANLPLDEWFMMVRSLEAGNPGEFVMRFDVYSGDGSTPLQTTSGSHLVFPSDWGLEIGKIQQGGANYRLHGFVGPLMMFDSCLTTEQRATLYNAGEGLFP